MNPTESPAPITIGGRTIAERQLPLLRATFPRVLVVANDPAPWAPLAVEVVSDRVEGAGPMGGVHAALTAADDCDAIVCVAGDQQHLRCLETGEFRRSVSPPPCRRTS